MDRPVGKFGLDAGVKPLLFFERLSGIFKDQRESEPRFNVISKRLLSLSSIESASL